MAPRRNFYHTLALVALLATLTSQHPRREHPRGFVETFAETVSAIAGRIATHESDNK